MLAGQRAHPSVDQTRAKILAAARELFERNGTRGTTTREVAERAGVNEATLFRHFGSKRVLLDAMREEACGTETFRSIIGGLPGRDIAADLRTLAYATVDHMLAKRSMMCISLAEDAAGTDDAPEWRGPQHLVADLAAYFESQRRAGGVKGEPLLLARCFLGNLFSYVVGRKLWGVQSPQPETIDGIVDVFLNGARA